MMMAYPLYTNAAIVLQANEHKSKLDSFLKRVLGRSFVVPSKSELKKYARTSLFLYSQ